MDKMMDVIGGVPDAKIRNDDDAIDRLSYKYTAAVLVVFAVVVTASQYVGDPIHCWVPAHFSDSHEAYTDSYCWVRNTYYLPFQEYIPKEDEHEKRHVIPYYQWVPLILLIQALLFYLPCMLWRTLNNRSGVDVNNIVELGEKYHKEEDDDPVKPDNEEVVENESGHIIEAAENSTEQHPISEKKESEKQLIMKHMTNLIDRYLRSQNDEREGFTVSLKHCVSRTCCIFCGRNKGNYLTVLYLFVKLLYIANVIGQLFLLTMFLGTEYYFYGFEVIIAMAKGEDWTESERFPRVTMCDFKVRRLGNIQRYTVQCVLSINLFNEKIYLFIWFWFMFLAVLTVFSLFSWSVRSILKKDHHRFVKRRLKMEKKIKDKDDNDRKITYHFVDKYLKQDGIFILRLVSINTDMHTANDLLCSLFDRFKEKTLDGEMLPRIPPKSKKSKGTSV